MWAAMHIQSQWICFPNNGLHRFTLPAHCARPIISLSSKIFYFYSYFWVSRCPLRGNIWRPHNDCFNYRNNFVLIIFILLYVNQFAGQLDPVFLQQQVQIVMPCLLNSSITSFQMLNLVLTSFPNGWWPSPAQYEENRKQCLQKAPSSIWE